MRVVVRQGFYCTAFGQSFFGAIQVLRNADGGGGVTFSGKKQYEDVRFNVIRVTRWWVVVQFPEKKALRNN